MSFQCGRVGNMVIPSSAPFGEARGEGQWCLPGLICQMPEGRVPKCSVRKTGPGKTWAWSNIGRGEWGNHWGFTSSTLTLEALTVPQNPHCTPEQSPCSLRCSGSCTGGVRHWRSQSWTTCGLRVRGLRRRRNVAWLTRDHGLTFSFTGGLQ